jgi:CHASE1-domain containing sensor protein
VIIKVLFAILVVSSIALIGVTIAVVVRVWWHLKSRRAKARHLAEITQESNRESTL